MPSDWNPQPPGSRPQSRASTMSATSPPDDHFDGRFRPAEAKQQQQHVLDAETMLCQFQTDQPAIPQQSTHYQQQKQQQQQQQQQQQLQQHYTQSTYQIPDMSHQFAPDGQPQQYMPLQQQPAYSPRIGSADVGGGPDDRRRKGSALTASNDRELREMLAKNEGRPLREVAQEVIQKERTPMAEKTKQLFAMLWLRAVCKPAKTSVPRNRVYSQYASRCGTERVVPLNPASFGKLVRVIFPGIQTRRLGVRGESKYHYVDLALEDESVPHASFGGATTSNAPNLTYDPRPRRSDSLSTQPPTHLDFNQPQRSLPPDTAAFPSTAAPYNAAAAPNLPSRACAFAYPDSRGMTPHTPESLTYPHTLRFPSAPVPEFSENEPVQLPALHPYLPPRTDPDTAAALYALYRTHCTSLIDSIRFCKEKQFFRLYTSFHGTLTVPVQKLFAHPSLAPWIESCDLVTYRTMIRFVSRLTLQAAPVVVINILSNISATLHAHLTKTFAAHPPHVVQAKLRPATIFARLLHRLIRVNQAAHAAANLLTIEQNRVQMWREWVAMVNPKRVVEAEVPPVEGAQEEVYSILTGEMRRLLEPLPATGPWGAEDVYGFTAYDPPPTGSVAGEGGFAEFLQAQTHTTPPTGSGSGGGGGSSTTENVLDRWAHFLYTLPSRFPRATARQLLQGLSGVGTAALRDVTILNGLSYGHWWVLKIFVDEMGLWLGEMGGFLEPEGCSEGVGDGMMFVRPQNQHQHQQIYGGGSTTTQPPGQTQVTMAFHHPVPPSHSQSQSQPQPPPPPPPPPPQQQQPPQGQVQGKYHNAGAAHHHYPPEADLDDSGIGLELMDAHSPIMRQAVVG